MAKRIRLAHIAYVRSTLGSEVADMFQQLEDAANSQAAQTTASAQGTTDPPPQIGSLTVTAANGIFDFAIVDNSPVLRGIEYFIDYSASAQGPWRTIHVGTSRNWRQTIDNGTYYFRAYSGYPTSPRSQPVYFGTAAAPTGVAGGGAVAGPALQASQGSGTSIGANGGDGGYGNQSARIIGDRGLELL